jgi:polysaccharide biosynthesis transport protein
MEEELQESRQLLDFGEIKGMIRRRRWQFLVPFFCGWLLVWGASWVIPSTYQSGTLILVEQPSVPEKYVVSNIDSDIQHQLDSITQQILSRTRLLRIIDNLGLYAQDRKHKSPDDLVEKMRKDIEIELSHGDDRKLSAFNIYYTSRDPKMAQAGNERTCEPFHHGESRAATGAFREHDQVPAGSTRSGARKTRGARSEIACVQGSAPG